MLSREFRKDRGIFKGLPFPPPGDPLDPGIKPMSPASPAPAGTFFTTETLGSPHNFVLCLTTLFAHLKNLLR